MVLRWLSLLIILGFVSCTPAATNLSLPAATGESTPQQEPIDEHLQALAAEFIPLRTAVGQFNGGDWNPDVDPWQSPKHSVMIALGEQLGNGRFTCEQLTNLLQAPDHTVEGGDPLHDLIQTLPNLSTLPDTTTQFLVYEWRSTHDFLFFVCQNGRVTSSGWWYAGE
ncbi:MAG: hypothetical protein DHS20C20_29380 [Ardenticatenaceae bacterium]|nr:MAG: hypothetical protein DHS20C20_29380 [Ardenticatenaceae bacterium]